MNNIYYNYFYLNPFKKGKYTYYDLPLCFLYEPFYVGKGKNERYLDHIKECKNIKKNSIKCKYIRKILEYINENTLKSFIVKINYTTNENYAFNKERIYINQIGLLKDNSGPLTNQKDKGRKILGHRTKKLTKKFLKQI